MSKYDFIEDLSQVDFEMPKNSTHTYFIASMEELDGVKEKYLHIELGTPESEYNKKLNLFPNGNSKAQHITLNNLKNIVQILFIATRNPLIEKCLIDSKLIPLKDKLNNFIEILKQNINVPFEILLKKEIKEKKQEINGKWEVCKDSLGNPIMKEVYDIDWQATAKYHVDILQIGYEKEVKLDDDIPF